MKTSLSHVVKNGNAQVFYGVQNFDFETPPRPSDFQKIQKNSNTTISQNMTRSYVKYSKGLEWGERKGDGRKDEGDATVVQWHICYHSFPCPHE